MPPKISPEMLDNFMGEHGGAIGNNKDLGLVVLNQLAARGVDLNAVSMDALQSVCDQIRTEAASVLDALNMSNAQLSQVREQALQAVDKVNQLDASVRSAESSEHGAPVDMAPVTPPPMDIPPMPTGAAPKGAEAEAPAGGEEAVEANVSVGEEAPVAEPPAAPQETPAPGPTNLQTLSDWRAKNPKKDVSAGSRFRPRKKRGDNFFRPGSGVLDAVRGL